jgi:hypothetical protein
MNEESIREFYSYAILPQFGIDSNLVIWRETANLTEDFEARYFSASDSEYALAVSENYEEPEVLLHYLNLDESGIEFIQPLMSSDISPSLQFVKPVNGLQYVDGVTDYFLLIKFNVGNT